MDNPHVIQTAADTNHIVVFSVVVQGQLVVVHGLGEFCREQVYISLLLYCFKITYMIVCFTEIGQGTVIVQNCLIIVTTTSFNFSKHLVIASQSLYIIQGFYNLFPSFKTSECKEGI